jgi:beta-galactosidase
VNGKKLLESGPKPDFWRAPIDNDFGNKMNKRLVYWEDYADNLQQVEMSWSPDSLTFFVRTRYTSPDKKSGVNLSYVFSGNGELGIIQDLVIRPGVSDYPELPAFGMQLALSGSLSNLEYFGRGQKRMQNIPFLLNQCNLHIL